MATLAKNAKIMITEKREVAKTIAGLGKKINPLNRSRIPEMKPFCGFKRSVIMASEILLQMRSGTGCRFTP